MIAVNVLHLWDHTMQSQRLFFLGTGKLGSCVRVEILGEDCPIPNQKFTSVCCGHGKNAKINWAELAGGGGADLLSLGHP